MRNCSVFLFFLSFLFILCGCKDDYSICTESKEVRFAAKFYQRVGGNEVITNVQNLTVFAIHTNSGVFDNQPNTNSINLPLIAGLDTAKFIITLSTTLPKDTLTIVYNTQDRPASSPECGKVFIYNITSVLSTTNTIDSVKIINPVVGVSLAQNAKLYF